MEQIKTIRSQATTPVFLGFLLKSIRCVLCHFSHVRLFETLWTVAWQAPLSGFCPGFSRPEYWSGSPCPPPGDLPIQGSNPHQLSLLYWQVVFSGGSTGKESTCNAGDLGSIPRLRTVQFWVGLYSLWGRKELDMTDFHCSLPLAPPGKPQKYIFYIKSVIRV